MKRADVVEHVHVVHDKAEKQNCKVEAPHHLRKTNEAIVLLDVEERKVPKAGHPHVAGNHHAHRVVHLVGMKVVVQQENGLHPSLPFLGLVTVDKVVALRVMLERAEREEQDHEADKPEKVGDVLLLAMLVDRSIFAHPHIEQNSGEHDEFARERQQVLASPLKRGDGLAREQGRVFIRCRFAQAQRNMHHQVDGERQSDRYR
mmetsp:Transcript_11210/g.35784  ORF Transcript_11210/g.35784 Transcript_11210/m.35784 type:complete len:203 (+) Transcript_11210:2591-3199(+)